MTRDRHIFCKFKGKPTEKTNKQTNKQTGKWFSKFMGFTTLITQILFVNIAFPDHQNGCTK